MGIPRVLAAYESIIFVTVESQTAGCSRTYWIVFASCWGYSRIGRRSTRSVFQIQGISARIGVAAGMVVIVGGTLRFMERQFAGASVVFELFLNPDVLPGLWDIR